MDFNVERLNRQKEEIENLIKMYKESKQNPINNYINTGIGSGTGNKELIEWRILNENEEVDNLYVNNKTLFVGDNLMVLKGIDGKLEKWEVKKVYPIDKKDLKINELEEEIKKLKEMINNEHTKFDEPVRKCDKSNADDDGDVNRKPKTSSRDVSKKE